MKSCLAWCCLFLSACFPTADPLGYRLCTQGASPCPVGETCLNGLCQPNNVQRLGADLNGTVLRAPPDTNTPLPVAGAIVEIVGAGLFAQTDASGQFRLRAIPVGQHQLAVVTASSQNLTEPRFEGPEAGRFTLTVDPADEGGTLQKDLILNRRGDLTGRIVLAGADPFADSHGGAVVYIKGIPRAGDLTSPDGSFLITGVPEGDHQLVVHSTTHGPTELTARVDGLTRNWIDHQDAIPEVNQSYSATISGQIQAVTQALNDTIQVQAFALFDAADQVVEIGTDGAFTAELQAPGPYGFTLRGEGWRPAQTLGIVPGQAEPVVLQAIAVENNDLDEDGIIDAEDPDQDGDGCPNTEDQTPTDPRGCGDIDEDGIPDALDADDECDGASDIEEVRPGKDGLITDHRRMDTTDNGRVLLERDDFAAMSTDGILRVLSSSGTIELSDPEPGFRYVVPAQQEALIHGPYTLKLSDGDASDVELLVTNHPARDGDELQLLRRPAGCTEADCTTSVRPDCTRTGYRNWLRCQHTLATTGVVDETLWLRQARRPINRIVDLSSLKNNADPREQTVCLTMNSIASIYGIFHRQIAIWRNQHRLEVGNPHPPSCYAMRDGCVMQPIRDDDGDPIVITDYTLDSSGTFDPAIAVVNASSSDPQLQVRSVLPGEPHSITATFSDGISEPQTLTINLILRGTTGAVNCW